MEYKPKFTKNELAIATKVVAETDYVRKWAMGELRAFKVDPASEAGKNFLARKRLELAQKFVNTAR
jgi:hypothetical protein